MNPSTQKIRSVGFVEIILRSYAAWVDRHNVPFLISSMGMIVMLFWAGAYKMTLPGADGIVPLVTNSPLISWHFKVFGTYLGSDLIGTTEWIAATFLLVGYRWPLAGIFGGIVGTVMFFTTSSMLLTTPDTLITVHGMKYMSFLGLFLYKDILCLAVAFYLTTYYGKKVAARD
jgi:reactive chlorine resistance protein C